MRTKPTHCPTPDCVHRDGPADAERRYGTAVWYTKYGYFYRKDGRYKVPRYQCRACGKVFSAQTFAPTHGQHKATVNKSVFKLLASGVTLRRTGRLVGITKDTVMAKLQWLADQAWKVHKWKLLTGALKTSYMQFDELLTYEHTKMKPLSVAVAVRPKTGEIIDFDVATVPAFGRIANRSVEKYGFRPDTRQSARASVFGSMAFAAKTGATLRTDDTSAYVGLFNIYLKRKGCKLEQQLSAGNPASPSHGGGFDPMFRLNHTFKKLRSDLARLARKTWATTKKIEGLWNHMMLYVAWNNGYVVLK